MSEQDIDIDFLISLVQERAIIWDKSHELYSYKFRKANEWVAVCKKIFQDYEEFEDPKKEQDCSLEMVSEETERNENTASSSPFPTKEMASLPPGPSRYVLQAVRDQTKQ
ncbi:unnamed protein product [Parnassius apollo]|uniref:(apollo) hypothetical protein n=1 Tax=Parnassius apollo TaxID=110799 RepID=A0A8S3XRQ9_PARAO|nr:unnamed protein product [Parnassius apollo]